MKYIRRIVFRKDFHFYETTTIILEQNEKKTFQFHKNNKATLHCQEQSNLQKPTERKFMINSIITTYNLMTLSFLKAELSIETYCLVNCNFRQHDMLD